MDTKLRSRRSILKILMLALAVLPLRSLISMIRDRMMYLADSRQPAELPLDLPDGISFHNNVIAWRQGETRNMLSARCSHLGCTVNRLDREELVCPCHGSRYSLDGRVLTGPATRNLEPLEFNLDLEKKKIIVAPPG